MSDSLGKLPGRRDTTYSRDLVVPTIATHSIHLVIDIILVSHWVWNLERGRTYVGVEYFNLIQDGVGQQDAEQAFANDQVTRGYVNGRAIMGIRERGCFNDRIARENSHTSTEGATVTRRVKLSTGVGSPAGLSEGCSCSRIEEFCIR